MFSICTLMMLIGPPSIADVTADFAYLRLQRAEAAIETGYSSADLDRWASVAKTLAAGGVPDGLQTIGAAKPKKVERDVFVFFIAAAKERNPAAAEALIKRLA